ncbi:MAG: toll/interleukin-1 receptor domain-containing protein [Rhodospirillales bacterium]|nr:toll/interleukin-1 receptor domain-containing protein [Rhodospirillales bacterium]
MKVFISYSHKDEAALDRLHTHLAVLRRDRRIDEWFDREILAGGAIDAEIAERLEASRLFLLLVSPDFLASDYCVEREMDRALERHRSGHARVVPIILEPCDWPSTPLRDLKALPRDGKPVSEWTNENHAFVDVVRELRRILDAEGAPSSTERGEATIPAAPVQPGVRRYRVKRDFDEIDRSDFREAAFGAIRGYFERAVAEIDAIEDLRGRIKLLSPASFTCTIVNRAREHGTAHITVHGRSGNTALGDISYSFAESAPPNTANGMFTVNADEYELYLSSAMGFGGDQERLTPEAAAERLWEDFLERAGVTSD